MVLCTYVDSFKILTTPIGEDCSVLRLSPLSSAAQLQSAVQPVGDATRWGGSVAEDGGKYARN